MSDGDWDFVELADQFVDSIRCFMIECNLRFGRLDFVTAGEIKYFLEVNPNGQWAWLDLTGKHGLLAAMVAAIEGKSSKAAVKY